VERMTDAENDALGAQTQERVLAAMRKGYSKHMNRPTLLEASITCGVAAIIEGGRLLHAITTNQDVAERIAFAYLRGAIRGLDHPIKEDGTPYTGAFDA
jgi:hypothetical protein